MRRIMENRNHIDVGIDRQIVDIVIQFISTANDKIQEELADRVEYDTNNFVTVEMFEEWLTTFDVENIN